MGTTVSGARSFFLSSQALADLSKADIRDFKQHWNKGIEEFHLRTNGYTEYVIARSYAVKSDSMCSAYEARVRNFGKEEVISVRFGSPLERALGDAFKAVDTLRASLKERVIEAVTSGELLEHVEDRESYSLNAVRKGVMFSSRLPDVGRGEILVRGDLSRDMSHPDQRLVLEVTWRHSVGTDGPLRFIVDRQYERLLNTKR